MARFLIEVPHEADPGECARAVQFFLRSGSHFMTRADWGCMDGVHKAFIVVEVDTKEEGQEPCASCFPFSGQDRGAKQVHNGGDRRSSSPPPEQKVIKLISCHTTFPSATNNSYTSLRVKSRRGNKQPGPLSGDAIPKI
jgi:hypothetical protein